MADLRITLFGCLHLGRYGEMEEEELPLSHSLQVLLAYLLLNRQRLHPREVLADLLWEEHDQLRARKCLNTAVWRLRKVLEPAGIPTGTYLHCSPIGELGFNLNNECWLDVAIFEDQVRHLTASAPTTVSPYEIGQLEETANLYKGDLLEGFYQDWVLCERERFRYLYLVSMSYLMQYYHRTCEYDKSVYYGQQVLRLEPLREDIHREIMRVYIDSGQSVMALLQYHQCCEVLQAELGIAPMEETQQLYNQITQVSPSSGATAEKSADLDLALQHLYLAQQRFERGKKDLLRASQIIEDLIKHNHPRSS